MAFKIKLDEKHYLNSDGLCYYITTASSSKNGKTYERRTSGYANSIYKAFNSYINNRIVSAEAENLKALTAEIEELKDEIRAWLIDLGEELKAEAKKPKTKRGAKK